MDETVQLNTQNYLTSLSLPEVRNIQHFMGSTPKLNKQATIDEILLHRPDGQLKKLNQLKKYGPIGLAKVQTLQQYVDMFQQGTYNFNIYQIQPTTPHEWFTKIQEAVRGIAVNSSQKSRFLALSYPIDPPAPSHRPSTPTPNEPSTIEINSTISNHDLASTNKILKDGFSSLVSVITEATGLYNLDNLKKEFNAIHKRLSTLLDNSEQCGDFTEEQEFTDLFNSFIVIALQLRTLMGEPHITEYITKYNQIDTRVAGFREKSNTPSSSSAPQAEFETFQGKVQKLTECLRKCENNIVVLNGIPKESINLKKFDQFRSFVENMKPKIDNFTQRVIDFIPSVDANNLQYLLDQSFNIQKQYTAIARDTELLNRNLNNNKRTSPMDQQISKKARFDFSSSAQPFHIDGERVQESDVSPNEDHDFRDEEIENLSDDDDEVQESDADMSDCVSDIPDDDGNDVNPVAHISQPKLTKPGPSPKINFTSRFEMKKGFPIDYWDKFVDYESRYLPTKSSMNLDGLYKLIIFLHERTHDDAQLQRLMTEANVKRNSVQYQRSSRHYNYNRGSLLSDIMNNIKQRNNVVPRRTKHIVYLAGVVPPDTIDKQSPNLNFTNCRIYPGIHKGKKIEMARHYIRKASRLNDEQQKGNDVYQVFAHQVPSREKAQFLEGVLQLYVRYWNDSYNTEHICTNAQVRNTTPEQRNILNMHVKAKKQLFAVDGFPLDVNRNCSTILQ